MHKLKDVIIHFENEIKTTENIINDFMTVGALNRVQEEIDEYKIVVKHLKIIESNQAIIKTT